MKFFKWVLVESKPGVAKVVWAISAVIGIVSTTVLMGAYFYFTWNYYINNIIPSPKISFGLQLIIVLFLLPSVVGYLYYHDDFYHDYRNWLNKQNQ